VRRYHSRAVVEPDDEVAGTAHSDCPIDNPEGRRLRTRRELPQAVVAEAHTDIVGKTRRRTVVVGTDYAVAGRTSSQKTRLAVAALAEVALTPSSTPNQTVLHGFRTTADRLPWFVDATVPGIVGDIVVDDRCTAAAVAGDDAAEWRSRKTSEDSTSHS